jgi:cysteine desulfurase
MPFTPSIYLDYNATAPVIPAVADAMREALCQPANASSVHGFGRAARKRLEDARANLAEHLSVFPREIVFTASGTEANNLALHAFAQENRLVSAIEHPSILQLAGAENRIPVNANGEILTEALEVMLATRVAQADGAPVVVSVMLANNETGVIQPIAEISHIVHRYPNAFLHVDAVQAMGKMPLDAGVLGCDLMTLSFHKCGGPVGVAALVVREKTPLLPLLKGGGQEQGRRAGTENIAALAGLSALLASLEGNFGHYQALRGWLNAMERELKAEAGETLVYASAAKRLPTTTCLRMPGVANETQLMSLDLQGFAVSAGSACSSGRVEPSHVLMAMGVEKQEAITAIRISAGWNTQEKEIQALAKAWKALFHKLSPVAKRQENAKVLLQKTA